MDRLTSTPPADSGPRQDTLSGAVLLVLALVYGGGALRIPGAEGEPGPSFVPLLLSGLLAIFAVWIMGSGLLRLRAPARPGVEEEGRERAPDPPLSGLPREARVWLAVTATVAYAALFQTLGFALATLAYCAVITGLFTRRRRVLALVPAAVTLLLFAFFRMALGVRLPSGLLG